jgi:hypothetical protein
MSKIDSCMAFVGWSDRANAFLARVTIFVPCKKDPDNVEVVTVARRDTEKECREYLLKEFPHIWRSGLGARNVVRRSTEIVDSLTKRGELQL